MPRIRGPELRQLDHLMTALLADADLMAELSLIEREYLEGTSQMLKQLLRIVELRDVEDTLNES
jgi:hypothetical protein